MNLMPDFLWPRKGIGGRRPLPTAQRISLNGAEDALSCTAVFALNGPEQILDLLPLGIAVGGAGALDNRKLYLFGDRADVRFGGVDQRTDHRDVLSVEMGERKKTVDASLIQKREHIGLDDIILMMTERNRAAAVGERRVVKRAAPEIGAERTGIGFFADVKHDLADVGFFQNKFDIQLIAESGDRGEIHIRKADIQRNCFEVEPVGIEPPQICQRKQQGERILSAGDADGDAVAVSNHMIIICRAADIREQFLHAKYLQCAAFSNNLRRLFYCTAGDGMLYREKF